MIDRSALLRDLQKEVTALEAAIAERIAADPKTEAHLRAEHETARAAGRTAESSEMWRGEQITQSAVAWVLACVFIRFLEDNELLPTPHLSGPGPRRQLALDQRQLYFQRHPTETDREYLQDVFREVATLPAAGDLLGEKHNPLWALAPSGDGATRILTFFQRIVPETGEIAHDFTDPSWNTRFLGDLYQDLSEAARKKYALLQTPEFVEEFILDRTLTPAIDTFGYQEVRLIDPTCGSGHFLLGAFHRLFALHQKHAPGTNTRELAQRALDQVAGVDLNPFAVAIARFRLLLAALRLSTIARLADAPGFRIHLATGDSLLHGKRFGLATMNLQPKLLGQDPLRHVYETEDVEALRRILGRQYHAVVGNPPYITVKDKALNQAYRNAYQSCHMKYSLGVPFSERFFELALAGEQPQATGFVGMITTNSFMKREFGKKLIEQVFPKLDLTHVIDTSGAYIPGHGTPTVILLGRHRAPTATDVRLVMGIRGEPSTPPDPSNGLVWQAILAQIDSPGSMSDFVSVSSVPRPVLSTHPWSIGGGGASELKSQLDSVATQTLGDLVESIGFMAITGEDEAYIGAGSTFLRDGIPHKGFGTGEVVRDWQCCPETCVAFPYRSDDNVSTFGLEDLPTFARRVWPLRTTLKMRLMFGKYPEESGLTWYEYRFFARERYKSQFSIAFAFVATHNHFVLDRGGKVFKQSAPVIKLPAGATEDDHIALLGLLNSSTACFWMKQVFQPKSHASQRHHPDPARGVYEFAGTQLLEFPIPRALPRERLVVLARELDGLARKRTEGLAAARIQAAANQGTASPGTIASLLTDRWREADALRERMVALQEEIDWEVYFAYGLIDPDGLRFDAAPDGLSAPRGSRPFEQGGGRRSLVRSGGSAVPLTEAEAAPVGIISPVLVDVWNRRRAALQQSNQLRLIERLEIKRVWRDTEQNIPESVFRATLDHDHLKICLLSALDQADRWAAKRLQSTNQLADSLGQDSSFMATAACLAGHADFDVSKLMADLVHDEAVPVLSFCRYTKPGIEKQLEWKRTWELQRKEDGIDSRTRLDPRDPQYLSEPQATSLKRQQVGDIPIPPKYQSADYAHDTYWSLRGKLDVPKERFISFPYCEREGDPSLVVGWAGWNHLERAEAIAAYYVAMKDTEGWPPERLTPLLAALHELVPWLEQWHNELHPEYGVGMGDYYRGFVETETRALGLTPQHLIEWKPPAGKKKGRAKERARQRAS